MEQQGDRKYKWVEQGIGVEELFAARRILVDKGEQQVGYVLLLGEAGTGKSTLVRKLAYVWAKGEGLQEVLLVYVLLVRDLLASWYDNQGDCFHAATLATAVVLQRFPQARGDKCKFLRLRKIVEQSLAKPTTLVVLDGLDESSGCS